MASFKQLGRLSPEERGEVTGLDLLIPLALLLRHCGVAAFFGR